MGILIRMCDTCGHYHSRLLRYCTEPRCACPEGPAPSVVAAQKREREKRHGSGGRA